MKRRIIFLLPLIALVSCSSNKGGNTPTPAKDPILINNINTTVYGSNGDIKVKNAEEGEIFSYSFAGDNIRIEEDTVIPLRGNTTTTVFVTSNLNREGQFNVKINNRAYSSTHTSAETSEGWFNEVDISEINSLTSEFANGMDISSMKILYDNGQRFYNSDGDETALPLILKDAGINWVRLRLWNDPKDTWEEDGEIKTFLYGGGNCDLESVTWMAHEVKAAGLNFLLDFHYSDYWTEPGKQIVPKAWVNYSTVSEMSNAISEFTTSSLNHLIENDARPDAVAIGNEVLSGILLHNPGGITKAATGDNPNYTTGKSNRSSVTAGRWDNTSNKASNYNLRAYIKAGVDAVKAVDPTIQTMFHTAKGFSASNIIINLFKVLDDLNIDIFAVSGYSYYHFSNISTLRNGLTAISNAFPNHQICIAETSYGYTFEQDVNANNVFQTSGLASPVSGYACSIQGQAEMLRDTTEVVSNLSNGWGVFYWEGAWPPCAKAGWADSASKASWANQGFFSYNGKATGALEVYQKMLGN